MKQSQFERYALSIIVAATTVAGCGGGSQPSVGPPGAIPQSSARATHAEPGKSWMLPEARRQDLLYVSANVTGEIYIFSYPHGSLVGTITGLSNPAGLCADKSGNVWAVTVTNAGAGTLLEYSHGGTSPIASLTIPGTDPFGCAVDPMTGNVAVTNSGDSVSVFAGGPSNPTTYTDSNFYHIFYCGYDDKGDLYADGNSSTGAQLVALPKGASSLEDVTVNAPINYPGAVQWDGKYVAVAELSLKVSAKVSIYRVQIRGSRAKVMETTTLTGKHFIGGFQGWIQNGTYIQPNKQSHMEGFWRFPQGGNPGKNVTTAGAQNLWGAAVSVAK
jgi:hypothetical protein